MKKINKTHKDIIFVKLGGSVLTDKSTPYTARPTIISQLAEELSQFDKPLVIAHGHGSYGHTSASRYGGKKGYVSKLGIAKVNFDVLRMNKIVLEAFIKREMPVVLLRPQSFISAREGRLESIYVTAFFEAFSQGLIPVVCGDVIWDAEWGSTIFSGEMVLSLLATEFIKRGYKIKTIIDVGMTDGVYDEGGKTIRSITKANVADFKEIIAQNKYPDVSGGMIHKIDEALRMSELGIRTLIINGTRKGELSSALKAELIQGTEIS